MYLVWGEVAGERGDALKPGTSLSLVVRLWKELSSRKEKDHTLIPALLVIC